MNTPFTGLEALLHDLFWQAEDGPQEAPHLLDILNSHNILPPSAILELGCGSGRILEPLANAGYLPQGCDSSADMLAGAKQRFAPAHTPPLHLTTIESLFFLICFNAVLIPGFTSMLLPPPILHASLANAHHHLLQNGLLIASFFSPWAELANPNAGKHWSLEKFLKLENGNQARYLSRYQINPTTHSIHRTLRYELRNNSGTLLRSQDVPQVIYWHEPASLHAIISKAGFHQIHCLGDFSSTPFDEQQHMLLTITAKRATPP